MLLTGAPDEDANKFSLHFFRYQDFSEARQMECFTYLGSLGRTDAPDRKGIGTKGARPNDLPVAKFI